MSDEAKQALRRLIKTEHVVQETGERRGGGQNYPFSRFKKVGQNQATATARLILPVAKREGVGGAKGTEKRISPTKRKNTPRCTLGVNSSPARLENNNQISSPQKLAVKLQACIEIPQKR